MVVIGAPTHPQVLFTGFTDADPGFTAMSALIPTARLLADGGMKALRAIEWDVVVSARTDVDAPDHMHVLALGCDRVGLARSDKGGSSVSYGGKQPSEMLYVADDLPDTLRRLVVGDLVPWLQAQPIRPFLMWSGGSHVMTSVGFGRPVESFPRQATQPAGLVPFVRDADGNMIAGAFKRSASGWCWALPFVPENPELWLAAALSDWHERTPERVPSLPGWRARAAWASPLEATIRADLAVLRSERQRLLAELDARETALGSAETAAIAAADAGPRRLLTAQGDKLVDAVTDALETLGYTVANVDNEEAAIGQPKVEDLRLSDPDEPGRTNITEVRGYTGGAKVSDLQRLARFAALYLLSSGALPTTRWYVVNQFLNTDPDTRRRPLAGSEDDLSVFAEDGGLVIDTRDLFHLARRVDEGELSTSEARALLRRAVGAASDAPQDEPAHVGLALGASKPVVPPYMSQVTQPVVAASRRRIAIRTRELVRRAQERGQSLQQYLAAETRSTSTSLGDGAVHRLLLLDVAGVDGDGTDPDQPAGGLPPAGARRSRSGTVLVALRPRVYQPSATRVRAEV